MGSGLAEQWSSRGAQCAEQKSYLNQYKQKEIKELTEGTRQQINGRVFKVSFFFLAKRQPRICATSESGIENWPLFAIRVGATHRAPFFDAARRSPIAMWFLEWSWCAACYAKNQFTYI